MERFPPAIAAFGARTNERRMGKEGREGVVIVKVKRVIARRSWALASAATVLSVGCLVTGCTSTDGPPAAGTTPSTGIPSSSIPSSGNSSSGTSSAGSSSSGAPTSSTASATGSASPKGTSTAATPRPPGTTPSAKTSGSTDPTVAPSQAGPGPILINITIKNTKVSPSGEKINVKQGQTVELMVVSDADDEIHAHNAGDGYELEVKAGQSAAGSFVASDIGSFEVESHHLEKVIVILNVR